VVTQSDGVVTELVTIGSASEWLSAAEPTSNSRCPKRRRRRRRASTRHRALEPTCASSRTSTENSARSSLLSHRPRQRAAAERQRLDQLHHQAQRHPGQLADRRSLRRPDQEPV